MYLPELRWSETERADLHVHSYHSDGQHSPRELAHIAARKGLRVIALTDHASIKGIAEMTVEAAHLGVYNIPGIELNGETGDFLGYFLDYEERDFLAFLDEVNHLRETRIKETVARLNELGYEIDWSALVDFSHPAIPSRAHIARMLVNQGRRRNTDTVFHELIGRGKPAYVPPEAPSDEKCIQMIQKAGGVAVLAHPHYLDISKNEIRNYSEKLASAGLLGYERVPGKTGYQELVATWDEAGKEFGLLELGGSSFHGDKVSDVSLGDSSIPCYLISEMDRRLPANSAHKSFFKRMLWRSINLSAKEFENSLLPEPITIKELNFSHLLDFDPNIEPAPPDYAGMPYILLGPGAINRHNEIARVLKDFGLQIVTAETRDNYPELAWTIYKMDKVPRENKMREILRFELDKYLYGNTSTKYRIVFFLNRTDVDLRRIKKYIRRMLGEMQFYRVIYGNLSDTFFTSFVHIPNENDINRESWILDQFGVTSTDKSHA